MHSHRLTRSTWAKALVIILLFVVVFVVAVTLTGLFSLSWLNWNGERWNWHDVLQSVGTLTVLGGYYGTIGAFDARSTIAVADQPLLRTLSCGALGAVAVLVTQAWPPETASNAVVAAGAVVGGVLGWLGWAWAKYVNL
ncbi:hypothetical protein [Massilia antarctica]|uniref:hypothetical protein n=1 Tax=Massilia antarctica TaxID=2765360 RepID=UPI0006BB6CD6|nr:hypothetical protein [Massilia sp. H27-R4]MCY0911240.1 hypothetical protein [Massilia sp. H27-R4]